MYTAVVLHVRVNTISAILLAASPGLRDVSGFSGGLRDSLAVCFVPVREEPEEPFRLDHCGLL